MKRPGTKVEYALLAALDLAEHYAPQTPVRVGHIAQRTGTPPKYLAQILLKLKSAALVNSVRGPHGGYWLMRRPQLISVAQVITACEYDPRELPSVSQPMAPLQKALDSLWEELEKEHISFLSSISLADLLAHAREASEE